MRMLESTPQVTKTLKNPHEEASKAKFKRPCPQERLATLGWAEKHIRDTLDTHLVLRSDLRPWDGLPLDYHHLVLPPTL